MARVFSLKTNQTQFTYRSVLCAFILSLVFISTNPASIIKAEEPTKPEGSGEETIDVFFPLNSVKVPAIVTADYILEEDLPKGIKYPPFTVGQAFTLGIWKGEGTTIDRFMPSVIINAKYQDTDIFEDDRTEEDKLQLFMYNPATKSWNKLCSSVDIYENIVSAALTTPTPFEENGSSLFAIAVDKTSPLNQNIDDAGTTTLTLDGSDLHLQVLRDEIEEGSHFTVTLLSKSSADRTVKLFSKPVDIKACRIDHNNPTRNNQQITSFYKRPDIGFVYDADTLSRAGGRQNLTIVNLQNNVWADVEEFGSRVKRGSNTISVSTGNLGTFGLTVR